VYRPLAFTAEQKSDESRHNNGWEMIGRLKPGATLRQAQAQLDAINAANMGKFPQFKEILTNVRFSTLVVPLQDDAVGSIRKTLYLLWGGAAFVLLIGVINITTWPSPGAACGFASWPCASLSARGEHGSRASCWWRTSC